jgi:hypothetical protein
LLVAALRRGIVVPMLVVSVALWGAAQLHHTLFMLADSDPSGRPHFALWTAWQLLFVVGFLIGWYRSELGRSLSARVHRLLLAGATVASASFLVSAVLVDEDQLLPWHITLGRSALHWTKVLFDKEYLAIGDIVYFAGLVTVLLTIITAGQRRNWWRRSRDALAQIGRRSLDCYIAVAIMTIGVAVYHGLFIPTKPTGQALAHPLWTHRLTVTDALMPIFAVVLWLVAVWRDPLRAGERRALLDRLRRAPSPS